MMIEQGRDDSMQETAEAIAQLATATASDRSTVATLTTTNAKLANQLEAAHALVAKLNSKIATLKIKLKPVWQGQRPEKLGTTTVIVDPTDAKLVNPTQVPRVR
jgi:predicted RNase H-like nuclease (RuvC/YqgF family)